MIQAQIKQRGQKLDSWTKIVKKSVDPKAKASFLPKTPKGLGKRRIDNPAETDDLKKAPPQPLESMQPSLTPPPRLYQPPNG